MDYRRLFGQAVTDISHHGVLEIKAGQEIFGWKRTPDQTVLITGKLNICSLTGRIFRHENCLMVLMEYNR